MVVMFLPRNIGQDFLSIFSSYTDILSFNQQANQPTISTKKHDNHNALLADF